LSCEKCGLAACHCLGKHNFRNTGYPDIMRSQVSFDAAEESRYPCRKPEKHTAGPEGPLILHGLYRG